MLTTYTYGKVSLTENSSLKNSIWKCITLETVGWMFLYPRMQLKMKAFQVTSFHQPAAESPKRGEVVAGLRATIAEASLDSPDKQFCCWLKYVQILLEEILQLIGRLSHYLQGSFHPRWFSRRISEPSTSMFRSRIDESKIRFKTFFQKRWNVEKKHC